MLDRSDLLWRDDDPTPATKPARDDHAKDDQARQVTERPAAPGHTRATAEEPARDGEDRPQEPAGRASIPSGPRSHAPRAIGGNTTPARKTPRRANGRAAAGPNARAMRWPTWGSIAPCPTQTCPTNILTATPTPPGAASIT